MIKRKILCFVLALAMMLSMMPVTPYVASADDTTEVTYDDLVGAVDTVLDKIVEMDGDDRSVAVILLEGYVQSDARIDKLKNIIAALDDDGEPLFGMTDISNRLVNALARRGITCDQAAQALELLKIWDEDDRVELVKSLDSDKPRKFFVGDEMNSFEQSLLEDFPDIGELFVAEDKSIDEFSFFAFAARQAIKDSIFEDDGQNGESIKFIEDNRFDTLKAKMNEALDGLKIKGRTFSAAENTVDKLFDSFEDVLQQRIAENNYQDADAAKQILGNYGLYQSSILPSLRLVPVYSTIDKGDEVEVDVVLEYINQEINDLGVHSIQFNVQYDSELTLANMILEGNPIGTDNYETSDSDIKIINTDNNVSYAYSQIGETALSINGEKTKLTLLTLKFDAANAGQAELKFTGETILLGTSGTDLVFNDGTTECAIYNSLVEVEGEKVEEPTKITRVTVDGKRIDKDNPTITIASTKAAIDGLINPTGATVTVKVNNDVDNVTVDDETGAFSYDFTGQEENNIVTIKAGSDTFTFTIVVDTLPPVINVVGVEEGGLYNVNKTITINYGTEENVTLVSAELNGNDIKDKIANNEPITSVDNTEEDFVLVVVAKDTVGNETTETINFTIDKLVPDITIIGVKDGETYGQTSVYFGSTEGTAEAKLNGSTYTNGTPITESKEHILVVTATDDAGNEKIETVTFTIDGVAPSILGDVTVNKTNVKKDDIVNIRFNVSDDTDEAYLNIGNISINNEMTIDGSMEASFSYTVPEGINAKAVPISVILIDANGNESDLITLQEKITIDNVKPIVFLLEDSSVIEYGENNYIVSDKLGFSIITDGDTIKWAVDDATLANPATVDGQTAPISWNVADVNYNDGISHTVYYKAIDEAGNESEIGSYAFKWDNTAPEAPVLTNENGVTNSKTVQLTAKGQNAEDYVLEQDSKVLVEKLRDQWILNKISNGFPTLNLREGINKFRASVKDSAGNVSGYSNGISIKRDTVKPLIKVEEVEAGKIVLTSNEDISNVSYKLNNGESVSIDDLVANEESEQIDIVFSEGNNKLVVTGQDNAGNEGYGRLTKVIVTDLSQDVQLTEKAKITSDSNDDAISGTSIQVKTISQEPKSGMEFASEPLDISVDNIDEGVAFGEGKGVVIDLDLGIGLPASTKLYYYDENQEDWIALNGNEHGDSIYNPGGENAINSPATIDGRPLPVGEGHLVAVLHHFSTYGPMSDETAPEITITSPNMSDNINVGDLDTGELVVTGRLSEECEAVTVNSIAATINADNTFTANIPIGDPEQGDMTITVVAEDVAGNESTETVDIFVDTKVPTVTFTAPTRTRNNPENVTINASDDNDVTTKVYKNDTDGELVFSTSAKGAVAFPVDLDEGNNTFVAVTTDKYGNISDSASKTIELDIEGPEITIEGVSDKDATAEAVSITVSSIEAGSTWSAELDADDNAYDTTFNSADPSPYTVNVVPTKEITYVLKITAQDELGNENYKEISFTIDDTLPIINVNGVSDGDLTKEDVTITVSPINADTLTTALTKNTSSASFESGDTLDEDGEYSLLIIATKTVGGEVKVATKTVDFTIDKTLPTISSVNDGRTYTGSVTPSITIEDINLDSNLTTITSSIANYKLGDEVSTTGTHTITVTATDKAGNEATKTITFTVRASTGGPSSGGGSSSAATKKTVKVPTKGGTYEMLSDEVVLKVEKDTFGEKVSITVEVIEDDIPALPAETSTTKLKLAGKVYEFDAKGKTFNKPVEVTLSYDKGSDIDASKLGVYVYNETTGNWDYVGGIVDAKNGTVTVTLNHFSKYAVMEYDRTFTDVTTHWAKDDIELMAARHIANGMTTTTFAPQGKITRAQFATLLVRALGLEISENSNSFADVNGEWFAGYVTTAYEAGLVNGMSDVKFAPEANVTREQMATMIMRAYSKKTNNDYNNIATTTDVRFNDESNISSWAHHAVLIANDLSIINGMGDDMFAPKADATRAQAIVMIKRLLEATDSL